ncbi:MAG TPA: DNA alkylation repair protein [Thermoclostridium sp.]
MNDDLVRKAELEIKKLSSTPTGVHIKTAEIRKLSARLFGKLHDNSREAVFPICELLLEQHTWPMKVIAFDFAYRVKKQYDDNTFALFENWLAKYVRGWGDCDDFCTHAFGELITQNTGLVKNVIPWTSREEFWMRRAAAVVLIPSVRCNKYRETNPTQISDLLMHDPEDLVLKGYGWMLKELSKKDPDLVYEYLKKNKEIMPRVAFRYALEKMEPARKAELMS